MQKVRNNKNVKNTHALLPFLCLFFHQQFDCRFFRLLVCSFHLSLCHFNCSLNSASFCLHFVVLWSVPLSFVLLLLFFSFQLPLPCLPKSLPTPVSGNGWTVDTLKKLNIKIKPASLEEVLNIYQEKHNEQLPPNPPSHNTKPLFPPSNYAKSVLQQASFSTWQ